MTSEKPPGTLDTDRAELLSALELAAKAAHAWSGETKPVMPQGIAFDLNAALPEEGSGLLPMTQAIIETIAPSLTRTDSTGFMGLITTNGNPYSLVADLLATAFNQHVVREGISPAATAVEAQVLRWIGALMKVPHMSGILTSGGSAANLTALAAARANIVGRGQARADLRIYASDQTHFSIAKMAELMGLGSEALCLIPSRSDFTIDIGALENAIAADRARGLIPMAIVANAGTVATGAVDDLGELSKVARREKLWLHADAAYGGPAAGTSAAGSLFSGLSEADSITVDAHKWLFVPYEAGCLLVKDTAALRAAFTFTASYSAAGGGSDALDFVDLGFQMSRDFKALKIWGLFMGAGAQGIRDAIEANIHLMRMFAERMALEPDFELMAPAPLSIVCFRYRPRGANLNDAALAKLNSAIVELLVQERRMFVTTVALKDKLAIRACCVNHRATAADTNLLIERVRYHGERLVAAC